MTAESPEDNLKPNNTSICSNRANQITPELSSTDLTVAIESYRKAVDQHAQVIREFNAIVDSMSKEDDHSSAWLYSKPLRDYVGMNTPFEQYVFGLVVFRGIFGACAHEVKRYLVQQIGKYAKGTDEWWRHFELSRVQSEADIKTAAHLAKTRRFGWVRPLLLYPVAWAVFVWYHEDIKRTYQTKFVVTKNKA